MASSTQESAHFIPPHYHKQITPDQLKSLTLEREDLQRELESLKNEGPPTEIAKSLIDFILKRDEPFSRPAEIKKKESRFEKKSCAIL